ncbi:MAG: hypothetical protein IJP18_06790 [Oscillospiraceae bacterium]|nr:hypothetical protein [Oscillospiraceae bacterium]
MYIGNECILTFEDPVCKDFLSGELDFEIIHVIQPSEPKSNLFIQTPVVIQCINPSVNDEAGKLKFSVQYKPSDRYHLKSASIIFNKKIEAYYEIRGRENTSNGNCSCQSIRIGYDSSLDMLYLEFENLNTHNENKVQISEYKSLTGENRELCSEINILEEKIFEKKKENEILLSEKVRLQEKIQDIQTEVDNLEKIKEDISSLELKKQKLRFDIEQSENNSEASEQLLQKLSYFDDILSFYKNDDGYDKISEKLEGIKCEIDTIMKHIAVLAQKRADIKNIIDDELNI